MVDPIQVASKMNIHNSNPDVHLGQRRRSERVGSPTEGLSYRQSLLGCDSQNLSRADLADIIDDDMKARLIAAVEDMRRAHEAGTHPILGAAFIQDDLPEAQAALAQLSEGASTIVFFGTGGSSLGGQVHAQAAGWNIPGDRGERRTTALVNRSNPKGGRRPRTRFYDNLDGRTLGRTLQHLDLEKTRFVITSKSGNTAETLIQAVTAIQAVIDAKLESRISQFFLCISEPVAAGDMSNGLRNLCARFDIPCLDHPTDIGGRYSGLSIVGMLPAMARGLDPMEIRAGAREVVADMARSDILEWAPAAGALTIAGLQANGGIKAFVMMPYADRLGRMAPWYAQLFGESLGKNGKGGMPVPALGPVDQHSQLQMWMDGPREHMITFIRERANEEGPIVSQDLADTAGIGYLGNRSAGTLVMAQGKAVPEALRRSGRPHRTFDVDEVDGRSVGALMMHFMIETILVGALMGVDPYDQPAVETGKKLARELLNEDD